MLWQLILEYSIKSALVSFVIYLVYSYLTWNFLWIKEDNLLRVSALLLFVVVLFQVEILKIKKEQIKTNKTQSTKTDYPI